MHPSIKIKILLLCITIFSFISCKKENSEIIEYLKHNNYSYIRGGTDSDEYNFIVLGKEKELGDSIIIFFDKNYTIKNYLLFNCPNSYQPVVVSEKYIVLGFMRNISSGLKDFIIYNKKRNEISFAEASYPFIWNLFIDNDNLFYSSEMANPHLNVVKLQTGEQYHYDTFYCPYAEFGIENGTVYATNDGIDFYVYQEGQFEKATVKLNSFNTKNYELKDFNINGDFLEKLH